MPDVFISYHQKTSSGLVSKIASALEAKGVTCWYAERDAKGAFAGAITEAIEDCKVFLLILNESANKSEHVLNEVGLAFGCYGKGALDLFPVRLDNCALSADMRYYLNRIHIMNGADSAGEVRMRELIRRVTNLVRKRANAQAASDYVPVSDADPSPAKPHPLSRLNQWLAGRTKKTADFWRLAEIIVAGILFFVAVAAIAAAIVNSRLPDAAPEAKEIAVRNFPFSLMKPTAGTAAELNYSNTLYAQGQEFFRQTDYANAIELFSEALSYHKEMKRADIDTARIECALGLSYRNSGKPEKAVEQYNLALGIYASQEPDGLISALTGGEQARIAYETGYAHYLRSIAYMEQYDFKKADEDCKACIDCAGRTAGGEALYSPALAYNLQSMIYLYSSVLSPAKNAFSSFGVTISGWKSLEVVGASLGDAFNASNVALREKNFKFIPTEDKALYDEDLLIPRYPDNWIDVIDKESTFTVSDFYNLIAQKPAGSLFLEDYDKKRIAELEDGIGFWLISSVDSETAEILTTRAFIEMAMFQYPHAYEDAFMSHTLYEQLPVFGQYNYPNTLFLLAMLDSAFYLFGIADFNHMTQTVSLSFEEIGQVLLYMKAQASVFFDKCLETSVSLYGDHPMTAGMYALNGLVKAFLSDSETLQKGKENILESRAIYERLAMEPQAEAAEQMLSMIESDEFHTARSQVRRFLARQEADFLLAYLESLRDSIETSLEESGALT